MFSKMLYAFNLECIISVLSLSPVCSPILPCVQRFVSVFGGSSAELHMVQLIAAHTQVLVD